MASLGIAGARGMGAALARLALRSGLKVTLFDPNPQSLEEARGRLTHGPRAGSGDQDPDPLAPASSLTNVRTTAEIADLANLDAVIETVVDTRDAKRTLLVRLDAACSDRTLLCTTTATQSISALGAAVSRPELLIGMHFLRPVGAGRVVEIVAGLRTSARAIERAHSLATMLGKTPIAAGNRPGFVVDRLAGMMRMEAVYAIEEGAADPQTIDGLLEAMGFASGPLAQLDTIGLDHALAAARALFESYLGESRFRPPLLLAEMVDAGWTGRSTGKGFHDYGAR
ncbi:MAG: 3-hydroxyacyl-CoA dehydrogenase family protein [Chloroflexota bacterium]